MIIHLYASEPPPVALFLALVTLCGQVMVSGKRKSLRHRIHANLTALGYW